ncbi:hypothetical protein P9112_000745 [Eukaryota sp. TZLM1-RC]
MHLLLPVRSMKSWARACSLDQFFEQRICDSVDGQLTKVTSMAHLGSLLVRVFGVRFPENSTFLTQNQLLIQCLDFVPVSEPKVRHPVHRPGKGRVYEKLQRLFAS